MKGSGAAWRARSVRGGRAAAIAARAQAGVDAGDEVVERFELAAELETEAPQEVPPTCRLQQTSRHDGVASTPRRWSV